MIKAWEDLPKAMQTTEVKEYYDILVKKKLSLRLKRLFDIVCAAFLLIALFIPMVVIAVGIAVDSPGGVFYRQERVTQYCKIFRIHKFRTMISNADKAGSSVTVENDVRVTRIGNFLRKYRLDELPQLIDVLENNMSFVGTRPESVKYVKTYTNEMRATLLLPAGITSLASIEFKNEEKLLNGVNDVDKIYIHKILPQKMKYNLDSLRNFSFWDDIKIMFKTVFVVMGKE